MDVHDQPVPRRFVVEITPTAGGRITGTVRAGDAHDPVAFSGWLDLLRLLEPAAVESGPDT